MKHAKDLPKLPQSLKVDVQKGETGALIAEIPDLGVVTEASDLNELFINVNDLIYTYFDIPQKYQDEIQFIPNVAAREELIKTANQGYKKSDLSHIKLNTYYTEEYCRRIMST